MCVVLKIHLYFLEDLDLEVDVEVEDDVVHDLDIEAFEVQSDSV